MNTHEQWRLADDVARALDAHGQTGPAMEARRLATSLREGVQRRELSRRAHLFLQTVEALPDEVTDAEDMARPWAELRPWLVRRVSLWNQGHYHKGAAALVGFVLLALMLWFGYGA